MTTKHLMTGMLATLVALHTAVAMGADKPKSQAELVKVATCKDGKDYYAPTNEHRGACSGHGGVESWADGSPVRAKGGKSARYR